MIIQGNDPYTQPSFSLGNRMARGLWGVVWLLFFRPSPRPLHAWRRLLLCLFGAKLGKHVHVYPNVKIWAPWQLVIGDKVGIADGVTLYNMAQIEIGDHCVVSQGAHLCGGTHDIDSANFQLVAKPIKLEKNVWVCAEAFIGPDVTLAEGCVVGARAVVVKSIAEPWSVWVGNPAIKKRMRKRDAMR
jgi:putative colanic acid biosynthesis acetyltransferase WcaF